MDLASWLNPELKVVVNADKTVLSTALGFGQDGGGLDGVIVDIGFFFRSIGEDGNGTGDWVGDLDLRATNASVKVEPHLLGRCCAEVKGVVLLRGQSNREAGHAALSSVESIPNVVHHCVDGVVEASFFIEKEDRLDSTVPTVDIETFKLEHADVVDLADVDLLSVHVDAVGVGASHGFIVRHNCEICSG